MMLGLFIIFIFCPIWIPILIIWFADLAGHQVIYPWQPGGGFYGTAPIWDSWPGYSGIMSGTNIPAEYHPIFTVYPVYEIFIQDYIEATAIRFLIAGQHGEIYDNALSYLGFTD